MAGGGVPASGGLSSGPALRTGHGRRQQAHSTGADGAGVFKRGMARPEVGFGGVGADVEGAKERSVVRG